MYISTWNIMNYNFCTYTGTYSQVSWCSSGAGFTHTQEPTLRCPGASFKQAFRTIWCQLSGILVQVSFTDCTTHRNLLLGKPNSLFREILLSQEFALHCLSQSCPYKIILLHRWFFFKLFYFKAAIVLKYSPVGQ